MFFSFGNLEISSRNQFVLFLSQMAAFVVDWSVECKFTVNVVNSTLLEDIKSFIPFVIRGKNMGNKTEFRQQFRKIGECCEHLDFCMGRLKIMRIQFHRFVQSEI